GSGANGVSGGTGANPVGGSGGGGAGYGKFTYSSGTITPGTTTIPFVVGQTGLANSMSIWEDTNSANPSYQAGGGGQPTAGAAGSQVNGSPSILYTTTLSFIGGAGGTSGKTLGG